MPSISVIIPTFNRAESVCKAVDSVLSQTHPPEEIIVIDDGSTDETKKVMLKFGDKVKYFQIEHTGLPAAARNIGIMNATSEYCAFLDSDDLWLPDFLHFQLLNIENNKNAVVYSTNAYVSDSALYFPEYIKSELLTFEQLCEGNRVIASTAIVRTADASAAGGFCTMNSVKAVEDYDLWLRLSCAGGVHYDGRALAVYSTNTDCSVRSSIGKLQDAESLIIVYRRAIKSASNIPDISTIPALLRIARMHLQKSYLHIQRGSYMDAVKPLFDCIKDFMQNSLKKSY